MRPTRSLANLSSTHAAGFSMLELLVALSLASVLAVLVIQGLLLQSNTFVTDVGRIRVQQNLRGALDVISMNVRQAGEGLDKSFPALVLADGNELTIRRKIQNEVLTACKPIAVGDVQLFVSDDTSTASECIPANLATSVAAWTTARTSAGGSVRIFLYDLVSKTGEFLDYLGEGTSGDSNYLTTSATAHVYPIKSTSVYILEEYKFKLDSASQTLQLYINGVADSPQDVAYKVTGFGASIKLQDDTNVTALDTSSPKTWKFIRSVLITLSGEDSYRNTKIVRSVNGEYFPRNVLS